MADDWTITIKQLRALYALDERGDKGLRTGARNTNASITYATAEALERRELVTITVDGGAYLVHVTDAGRAYAEKMRQQGVR